MTGTCRWWRKKKGVSFLRNKKSYDFKGKKKRGHDGKPSLQSLLVDLEYYT
jgi:hypothetical protein